MQIHYSYATTQETRAHLYMLQYCIYTPPILSLLSLLSTQLCMCLNPPPPHPYVHSSNIMVANACACTCMGKKCRMKGELVTWLNKVSLVEAQIHIMSIKEQLLYNFLRCLPKVFLCYVDSIILVKSCDIVPLVTDEEENHMIWITTSPGCESPATTPEDKRPLGPHLKTTSWILKVYVCFMSSLFWLLWLTRVKGSTLYTPLRQVPLFIYRDLN